MSDATVTISYTFKFEGGEETTFNVVLDEASLQHKLTVSKALPDWTKLACNKCPNCPLKEADHPHCPAAVSLIDVIDFFADRKSIEMAEVIVKTKQRTYTKEVALQRAVTSLMGILMSTSGCPVLGQLRPMVQFHLPFADSKETLYRNVSFYLVKQYLEKKRGGKPDWDLKHIREMFADISKVNVAFIQRLRLLKVSDSTLNAIITLNCFTDYITLPDDNHILDTLRGIFLGNAAE